MKNELIKLITYILALMVSILISSTIIYAQSDTTKKISSSRLQITLNDFAVGAKIAEGRKVEGGCEFEPMDMTLEKTEAFGEWIIYSVDEACNLIVDARWSGSIQDAPEPFRELLSRSEPEGKRILAQQGDNTDEAEAEIGSALMFSTCETHKNTVMTYGGGGLPDKLTELTGWIVACRNGSGSFISGSNNGTCWAATWPSGWDWVIDGCVKYGFELQSWTVAGQQRGDYHCAPPSATPCNISNPDGYYHSLYLSQRVYFSGSAYCTRSASGNYVFGPWGYNVQGCA